MQDIKVKEDNVGEIFEDTERRKLDIRYDPMRTITHVSDDDESIDMKKTSEFSKIQSKAGISSKSLASRSQMQKSRVDTTSHLDGIRLF